MAKDAMLDIGVNVDPRGVDRSINAIERRLNRASKKLRLDHTAITQPLGKISTSALEFEKSMEAANARVIAFTASVGIMAAFGAAMKLVAKQAVEFEKRMADINVILGANRKELGQFSKSLFKIARETGQSFDIVSNSALEFSRQGLGMTETLKRVNDALILTRLTGMSVEEATSALTATINAFTKEVLTSTEIVNKFASLDAAFSVSAEDMANSLKRAASAAEGANISFEETIALTTALQQITARGGNVIGNSLKSIFTRLSRSSTIEQLKEMGVQINETQGGIEKLKALANALESVDAGTANRIKELAGGVFQINAVSAALSDLSREYSIYDRAMEIAGRTQDDAILRNKALNETAAAGLNALGVSINQISAKIGDKFFNDLAKDFISIGNAAAKVTNDIIDMGSSLFGGSIEENINNIRKLIEDTTKSAPKLLELFSKPLGPLLVGGISILGSLILKTVKFAKDAAGTFSHLSKELKKQEGTHSKIASALNATNSAMRSRYHTAVQIAEQERIILEIQRMQNNIRAASLASYGGISRVGVGKGAKAFAGGRNPIEEESRAIRKGVGGASPSAKPVVVEDFAYGGGKRGMAVINSDEILIRGYAKGADAVFNRDMLESAGGFARGYKFGGRPTESRAAIRDELIDEMRIANTQMSNVQVGAGPKIETPSESLRRLGVNLPKITSSKGSDVTDVVGEKLLKLYTVAANDMGEKVVREKSKIKKYANRVREQIRGSQFEVLTSVMDETVNAAVNRDQIRDSQLRKRGLARQIEYLDKVKGIVPSYLKSPPKTNSENIAADVIKEVENRVSESSVPPTRVKIPTATRPVSPHPNGIDTSNVRSVESSQSWVKGRALGENTSAGLPNTFGLKVLLRSKNFDIERELASLTDSLGVRTLNAKELKKVEFSQIREVRNNYLESIGFSEQQSLAMAESDNPLVRSRYKEIVKRTEDYIRDQRGRLKEAINQANDEAFRKQLQEEGANIPDQASMSFRKRLAASFQQKFNPQKYSQNLFREFDKNLKLEELPKHLQNEAELYKQKVLKGISAQRKASMRDTMFKGSLMASLAVPIATNLIGEASGMGDTGKGIMDSIGGGLVTGLSIGAINPILGLIAGAGTAFMGIRGAIKASNDASGEYIEKLQKLQHEIQKNVEAASTYGQIQQKLSDVVNSSSFKPKQIEQLAAEMRKVFEGITDEGLKEKLRAAGSDLKALGNVISEFSVVEDISKSIAEFNAQLHSLEKNGFWGGGKVKFDWDNAEEMGRTLAFGVRMGVGETMQDALERVKKGTTRVSTPQGKIDLMGITDEKSRDLLENDEELLISLFENFVKAVEERIRNFEQEKSIVEATVNSKKLVSLIRSIGDEFDANIQIRRAREDAFAKYNQARIGSTRIGMDRENALTDLSSSQLVMSQNREREDLARKFGGELADKIVELMPRVEDNAALITSLQTVSSLKGVLEVITQAQDKYQKLNNSQNEGLAQTAAIINRQMRILDETQSYVRQMERAGDLLEKISKMIPESITNPFERDYSRLSGLMEFGATNSDQVQKISAIYDYLKQGFPGVDIKEIMNYSGFSNFEDLQRKAFVNQAYRGRLSSLGVREEDLGLDDGTLKARYTDPSIQNAINDRQALLNAITQLDTSSSDYAKEMRDIQRGIKSSTDIIAGTVNSGAVTVATTQAAPTQNHDIETKLDDLQNLLAIRVALNTELRMGATPSERSNDRFAVETQAISALDPKYVSMWQGLSSSPLSIKDWEVKNDRIVNSIEYNIGQDEFNTMVANINNFLRKAKNLLEDYNSDLPNGEPPLDEKEELVYIRRLLETISPERIEQAKSTVNEWNDNSVSSRTLDNIAIANEEITKLANWLRSNIIATATTTANTTGDSQTSTGLASGNSGTSNVEQPTLHQVNAEPAWRNANGQLLNSQVSAIPNTPNQLTALPPAPQPSNPSAVDDAIEGVMESISNFLGKLSPLINQSERIPVTISEFKNRQQGEILTRRERLEATNSGFGGITDKSVLQYSDINEYRSAKMEDISYRMKSGVERPKYGGLKEGFVTQLTQSKEELQDLSKMGADIASSLENNFANAFHSFATGAMSAKDAMRSFAASVASEVAKMLAIQGIKMFLGAMGFTAGTPAAGGSTPDTGAIGIVPNFATGSKRELGGVVGALMRESSMISSGVGGAKPSARPVIVKDFKGEDGVQTIIANSDEYLVRNYKRTGKDAIFNREMVDQVGGLEALKGLGSVSKVAAGGEIPSEPKNQSEGVNFGFTINISRDKAETDEKTDEQAGDAMKQFSQKIKGMVQQVIIQERRPGGLLRV